MTSKLQHDCEAFIDQNPQVWELFVHFTKQAMASGHKHLSADMVLHRIRWQTNVETVGAGDAGGRKLKVNNNHASYLARLFHQTYPEHDGFFRLRRLTSNG